MGEFRDFLDAFEDLQGTASKTLRVASKYGVDRSIARQAKDGTCYFPMIVDSTAPVDHALTVARALERTYASFVLTTFTMNPYMQMDSDGEISAADFVHQFHQNMDLQRNNFKIGAAALAMVGDTLAEENANFANLCTKYGVDYKVIQEGATQIAFAIYEGVQSGLHNKKCARLNFSVMEELNPNIINAAGTTRYVYESHSKNKNKGGGGNSGGNNNGNPTNNNGGNGSGGNYNPPPVNITNNLSVPKNRQPITNNITSSPTINVNVPKSGQTVIRRAASNGPMNHMVNTEYKKANDMVPTMLHVRVIPTAKDNEGELPETIDFVLGVKVTVHAVDSDVMIDELAKGVNAEDTFFNFIKWYTGETKFVKDFLFAIDQQKYDAKNAKSKNHNWLIASKRRKNLAKIQSKLFKQNPMTPILSVLVTTDTLEGLLESYGFDLKKQPRLIQRIMSTYYLLGFIIYDGTTQRVDMTIDGMADNQVYSISTLEKEQTSQDRQFKEMMRAMGRSM